MNNLSREEIEVMFGLSDLKKTRFYQEAKEEGRQEAREEARQEGRLEAKLKAVPKLLGLGLSIEQIAQVLDLDVARVKQVAQQTSPHSLEHR